MSPFPYIKEISDLERIDGFNDVVKIMGMVFSTVPWTETPYEKFIEDIKIEETYYKFKNFKLGGWCGLNAEFFKKILEGYSIRSYTYDFGFPNTMSELNRGFTHMGVVVELDGIEYFFDPYFARCYICSDGTLLAFERLLRMISEKKFNEYTSIFLTLKKPVINNSLTEYLKPQELMERVLKMFNEYGLKEILIKNFGEDIFENLMLKQL